MNNYLCAAQIIREGSKHHKILVIDDHPDFLELTREYISRAFDVEIIEARSGNEAITLIQQHEFAIIISDMNMPNGNGLSVLSFLENNPQFDSYFIVFTNATIPPDFRRRITVIDKPNFQQLISVLRHLEVFGEK